MTCAPECLIANICTNAMYVFHEEVKLAITIDRIKNIRLLLPNGTFLRHKDEQLCLSQLAI